MLKNILLHQQKKGSESIPKVSLNLFSVSTLETLRSEIKNVVFVISTETKK